MFGDVASDSNERNVKFDGNQENYGTPQKRADDLNIESKRGKHHLSVSGIKTG